MSRLIGAAVHALDTVDSTQMELARLAEEGAPEGTVVIAHGGSQAKGIASACRLAADLARGRITERIRERLGPSHRPGHFLRRQ